MDEPTVLLFSVMIDLLSWPRGVYMGDWFCVRRWLPWDYGDRNTSGRPVAMLASLEGLMESGTEFIGFLG